jgi:hypothetical protein
MPVCRATAITADGSCLLCRYLGTGQDVTGATVHKYAFLKTETTPETFGEAPRAPHDERPKEITWREVKPIAATNFSGSGYNTYYRPSAAPEAAEHVKETWASRQCMQGPLAGATRFEPEIGPLFSSHRPTLLLTSAHSSPHRSPLFSSQEPTLLLTSAHSSPHRSPLFSSHQPTLLLTGALSSPHRSPLFSSQEPAFASQVDMQLSPPPLPLPKPKGKERKAKELAVAEQRDDGQPASRLCVHLCAGTAIQSVCRPASCCCYIVCTLCTLPPPSQHLLHSLCTLCTLCALCALCTLYALCALCPTISLQCTMAAKYDYSVVVVDDGAGGPDQLLQYNPYFVKRPAVNPQRPWTGPQLELDRLSSLLQSQGRGEGGNHPRRLVLLQQSTSTLEPHQMQTPSVVLLDTSCRTRSTNSQGWHQRKASNFQLGITDAAAKDDIELAIQLVTMQWWP